jgi:hypothetical protein
MSKDYNTFIDKYLKVKKVIESCKTLDHTKVTKQMIENLDTVNLRCNFNEVYINNLNFFLKLKTDELKIFWALENI